MGFIPFYEVEPDLAERETRVITVIRSQGDLPEGAYALVESFCPDPACDCRRVMLNIALEEQLERGYLATISFGFDRDEEMAGPFLDPLNPQSEYSQALLELVTTSGLSDRTYVERLEGHYDRGVRTLLALSSPLRRSGSHGVLPALAVAGKSTSSAVCGRTAGTRSAEQIGKWATKPARWVRVWQLEPETEDREAGCVGHGLA